MPEGRRSERFRCKFETIINSGTDSWVASYDNTSSRHQQQRAVALAVTHHDGQKNQYRLTGWMVQAFQPTRRFLLRIRISGFATSGWISSTGPHQRMLKKSDPEQPRLHGVGEQNPNPKPGAATRVDSWSEETDSIIHAEGMGRGR